MEHLDEIKKILDKFNEFYWNSEMINDISLIDDLRLSRNIHETAHSRILYRLLLAHTKKEPFSFLKYFFEYVGLKGLCCSLDYKNLKVQVEYKNIDVLISDGKKCIIIENKVNHACDQDRQLKRYINLFNSYDVYVLYLVRNQTDDGPSGKSLPYTEKCKMEQNGHFRKISYQVHILKWLDLCKRKLSQSFSLLGSALLQYSNYLDKIINDKSMMEEKDAKVFEENVLGLNETTNPLDSNDRVVELKDKMNDFLRKISDYELYFKNRYLEYFKKQINIVDARLSKDGMIEFSVNVEGSDVLFVYDFLNTHKAESVWFGTKYPFVEYGNSEALEKTIGQVKTKKILH